MNQYWESKDYYLQIPNINQNILGENSLEITEISDKLSRVSKSLINTEVYKQLGIILKDVNFSILSKVSTYSRFLSVVKEVNNIDFFINIEINTFFGINEKITNISETEEEFNINLLHNKILELYDRDFLIIKIFSIMSRPICQLIYFLTKTFNVYLFKPRLSLPYSSENFLILKRKYIKNSNDYVIEKFDFENKINTYIKSYNINLPEDIEKILFNYNTTLVNNQIKWINFLKELPNDNNLKTFQIRKSLEFCNLYNIRTNIVSPNCQHAAKKNYKTNGLKNVNICLHCFSLII